MERLIVPESAFAYLTDIRRAESLEMDTQLGHNLLASTFSHSLESDYESYGLSENDAIDFNEKNTTLQFGLSTI